jgi:hypothetical protein
MEIIEIKSTKNLPSGIGQTCWAWNRLRLQRSDIYLVRNDLDLLIFTHMEPITTMSAATLATIASQNVIIFGKDPFAIFYVIMKPFFIRSGVNIFVFGDFIH